MMRFESSAVAFALGLTAFAGLATGIGSALAFFARRTSFRFLSSALGFSAGVMLYVSFVEILPKASGFLSPSFGEKGAAWAIAASFFAGALAIGAIDLLIPSRTNPHEVRSTAAIDSLGPTGGGQAIPDDGRLLRMGLFSAIAIAIHNFPEGVATFLAALENPRVGVAIAVAVALHNIPEGVSVSVPIYYATGSRKRAFFLSALSGLSEPVGAIFVYALLRPFIGPGLLGVLFAAVAGIMVYVSLDELLPTARQYGHEHEVVASLFSGMAVMAVSLLLMK